MLRGSGGQDTFFDESDWICFYDLLEEGVKRFDEDHLSLTELCTRLGRDLCSLSQAVNRLHKRAATNPVQRQNMRG